MLRHIAQLAPVLQQNADVIATVQEGFIGLWGEGYYSDYFSTPNPDEPGAMLITDQNWVDRHKVLKALLSAVPEGVTVDVSTPQMKQLYLGVPTGAEGAVTAEQAFTSADIARIGHHNDCFLASEDDYGTILSDPLTLDEEYLDAETRYVMMGGETCDVNPPKSEWPMAKSYLERWHFTYLNSQYNPQVLNSWGDAGKAEATNRLGYRLSLTTATLPTQVRKGGTLSADITIENTGFAAPIDDQDVQLVVYSKHRTYRLPVSADTRRWLPGTTKLHVDVTLPPKMPAGTYRLALALPSSYPSLAGRPEYAIRTANVGTWDAKHGWNNLNASVKVTG